MSVDPQTLANKVAHLERHLARVADRLPATGPLLPMTDASDAVILHLWQAVQLTIDTAVSLCVARGLGAPPTYAEAFRRLAQAGILEDTLAERLVRAAGFRDVVAHAYDAIDLVRVALAARSGPADLRAFFRAVRDHVQVRST